MCKESPSSKKGCQRDVGFELAVNLKANEV